MTAAWKLEGLTPTQKLVLLSLADNANDQGECYPSMAQIGRRTALSERAVRDAIRSLERLQIVSSAARSGTSTVYFLRITDALECQPTPAAGAAPANHAPRQQVPPNHHLTVI